MTPLNRYQKPGNGRAPRPDRGFWTGVFWSALFSAPVWLFLLWLLW